MRTTIMRMSSRGTGLARGVSALAVALACTISLGAASVFAQEPAIASVLVGRWQGGRSNSPLYTFGENGACSVDARPCRWTVGRDERRTTSGGRITQLQLSFADGAVIAMQLHVFVVGGPNEFGIALNNESIPRVVGATAREQAIAEAHEREREYADSIEVALAQARSSVDTATSLTQRRDRLLELAASLDRTEALRPPAAPDLAARFAHSRATHRQAIAVAWTTMVNDLERVDREVATELTSQGVSELAADFSLDSPGALAWLRAHRTDGLYARTVALLLRYRDAREVLVDLESFVPPDTRARVGQVRSSLLARAALVEQARRVAAGVEQLASEVVLYCQDVHEVPRMREAARRPSSTDGMQAPSRLRVLARSVANREAFFETVGLPRPSCDSVTSAASLLERW